MITHSTHARIVGDPGEVKAWAQEFTQLVNSIVDQPVEISMRFGGGAEVFVVSKFDNMAALEAQIECVEGNREYQAMVKTAMDKGYFDASSIQHGMWRSV